MAPPPAQGQQAPASPPSLFKQPLAAEFAAPAPAPQMPPPQPQPQMQPPAPQPQPNLDIYGGMTPGDALGGGLTMRQPQQQPQMAQLLSVMPADFAAQITPEQLAALTPNQMTEMIAKFSQPQTPNQVTIPVMPRDYRPDYPAPQITDYMGKGQVYGLGRSNPLSM